MARFLAGAASCFLMMTGAFLIWQSQAQTTTSLPPQPQRPEGVPSMSTAARPLQAPEATPKSREERRFSRADKDKNGRIEREEMLGPRRKAFAKLDGNGNGMLSFEEWAVKSNEKFSGADHDRWGTLTAAEFATTAPPPAKKKRCAC